MLRWGTLIAIGAAACTTSHDSRVGEVEQALTKCPAQVIEGLDVYSGTGTIDWTKVQASGRGFAFIKATQGDYNTQTTFATNWANALAAGVKRSPYHFFDGTVDGVAQANAFLGELQAAGGLQVGDLPALLDIECPTSSVQASAQTNCEHTGDSGWVDVATLKQRVYDWLDTVQMATGRAPIIYSYPSWFADLQMTDMKLASYPLFIASYNSCATIPAPWTTAVFWQYSATGTVPGVTGNADVDRFFGSADDLNAFTIQPAPQPDAGMIDPMTPPPETPAGCGCRTSDAPTAWSLAAIGLVLVLRRRRK
jgi:MYXO-CTERM domain-containing protein